MSAVGAGLCGALFLASPAVADAPGGSMQMCSRHITPGILGGLLPSLGEQNESCVSSTSVNQGGRPGGRPGQGADQGQGQGQGQGMNQGQEQGQNQGDNAADGAEQGETANLGEVGAAGPGQ
ncbi:hypothetical protein [Streptomyces sp. NPDC047108]|uniref:hypothetical protein n=1 Tax=Streptomyces sp. NPDC047108 TaxID=3155025 RepID=UPI0033FA71CC